MAFLQRGVAFFDSGIGGLTVLSACEKLLPNENFYYYGDNTNAPYGNLPKEQIRVYVKQAFDLFARLHVKAAVIACNTVTALFADELRRRYDFPIIGAEPAVLQAAKCGGEIYVLTTRATYESTRFQNLCDSAGRRYPNAKIIKIPCDGLAGEIENKIGEREATFQKFLPAGNPSAIVLGCTHYIYIKEYIRARYACPVFDGNEGIANRLRQVLALPFNEKLGYSTTEQFFFRKSRDGRPPNANFVVFPPFFYSKNSVGKKKRIKANKCSHLKLKKAWKIKANNRLQRVCFLGKSAQKNLNFYKQTFAFQ